MSETKRGYRLHEDHFARKEAKELGPYPPWKGWRNNLHKFLETNSLGSINSEEDEVLHKSYRLGRLHQKGEIGEDKLKEKKEELVEENSELFERSTFVQAFRYIEKRTKKKEDD